MKQIEKETKKNQEFINWSTIKKVFFLFVNKRKLLKDNVLSFTIYGLSLITILYFAFNHKQSFHIKSVLEQKLKGSFFSFIVFDLPFFYLFIISNLFNLLIVEKILDNVGLRIMISEAFEATLANDFSQTTITNDQKEKSAGIDETIINYITPLNRNSIFLGKLSAIFFYYFLHNFLNTFLPFLILSQFSNINKREYTLRFMFSLIISPILKFIMGCDNIIKKPIATKGNYLRFFFAILQKLVFSFIYGFLALFSLKSLVNAAYFQGFFDKNKKWLWIYNLGQKVDLNILVWVILFSIILLKFTISVMTIERKKFLKKDF